MIHKNFDVT